MKIPFLINLIHQGQTRKTGEKFTNHLYAVRDILLKEGVSEQTILDSALLHDALENSSITKEYLALRCGHKVARIVDMVSKKDSWKTSYCKMKSNMDEMEIAWIEWPEAILIKMADRLHNLQTIHGFSRNKQKEYLEETKVFLLPVFEKTLKRNHLGYLKAPITGLLQKLRKEVKNIEHRLSLNP